MPGNEDTPGLVIGATLSRDPPGDALVLRDGVTLSALRQSRGKGFKIGTNAVRRAAYARRLFPDVEIIHFRGAADTRVRKLDNGEKQRLPDGGAVGPADALIMFFPPSDCQAEWRLLPNAEFRPIQTVDGHLALFGADPNATAQLDKHLGELLST